MRIGGKMDFKTRDHLRVAKSKGVHLFNVESVLCQCGISLVIQIVISVLISVFDFAFFISLRFCRTPPLKPKDNQMHFFSSEKGLVQQHIHPPNPTQTIF